MATEKTLIVKLTGDAEVDSGPTLIRSILRALGDRAVHRIEPVFPGETEADLATLFNVTLDRSMPPERALEALRGNRRIEYAHTPQQRKAK
jgi:hypothetical protein